MTLPEVVQLADLRGYRSAPPLKEAQRLQLQSELRQRVAVCDWCTIGVMAPGSKAAWAALRSFEQALGWQPLPAQGEDGEIDGAVFLKGHQGTGQVWLRAEEGLGEGVLVSGHSARHPELQDTWGPFPLAFFAIPPSQEPVSGAITL